MLLAAACRARKIPTRIAVGLVYSDEDQAFVYHMWNEVWIKDRWIAIDATLGLGGIGAGHIKVLTTSLDTDSAYSTLVPLLSLIGRLEIELVEYE